MDNIREREDTEDEHETGCPIKVSICGSVVNADITPEDETYQHWLTDSCHHNVERSCGDVCSICSKLSDIIRFKVFVLHSTNQCKSSLLFNLDSITNIERHSYFEIFKDI